MTEKRKNDGRKSDGTFAPGNRLGGSKAGSRHRVTRAIEEMLEGQHEKLTQSAIDKALEGDMVALRLCLDRIAPPRKDAPVSIDLPPVRSAADAVEASAAVLAVVGIAYSLVAAFFIFGGVKGQEWAGPLIPVPGALVAFAYWRWEYRRAWIDDPSDLPEGREIEHDDWRIGLAKLGLLVLSAIVLMLVRRMTGRG
ncbi:hypothetical protein [Sphingobium yanoikuyae]|uniref:hypothetical protein n=1 Tax=Sphingobium yanoikuyae TaxID=13690 RepID=UPI000262BCE0|nr:hypothetical protein [Sphingobium yanoikuyae]